MNDLRCWQDALGVIVTAGAAGARFAADPEAAVRALLPAAALGTVDKLDPAAVARYARSLLDKRWGEVSSCLPVSGKVIAGLGRRYRAWLAANPPSSEDSVLSPGAAEALRALPALAAALGDDPGEAPVAAELLVFETLHACSRQDRATRFQRARYPIHSIVDQIRAGLPPVDPTPQPHRYTFTAGGVQIGRDP